MSTSSPFSHRNTATRVSTPSVPGKPQSTKPKLSSTARANASGKNLNSTKKSSVTKSQNYSTSSNGPAKTEGLGIQRNATSTQKNREAELETTSQPDSVNSTNSINSEVVKEPESVSLFGQASTAAPEIATMSAKTMRSKASEEKLEKHLTDSDFRKNISCLFQKDGNGLGEEEYANFFTNALERVKSKMDQSVVEIPGPQTVQEPKEFAVKTSSYPFRSIALSKPAQEKLAASPNQTLSTTKTIEEKEIIFRLLDLLEQENIELKAEVAHMKEHQVTEGKSRDLQLENEKLRSHLLFASPSVSSIAAIPAPTHSNSVKVASITDTNFEVIANQNKAGTLPILAVAKDEKVDQLQNELAETVKRLQKDEEAIDDLKAENANLRLQLKKGAASGGSGSVSSLKKGETLVKSKSPIPRASVSPPRSQSKSPRSRSHLASSLPILASPKIKSSPSTSSIDVPIKKNRSNNALAEPISSSNTATKEMVNQLLAQIQCISSNISRAEVVFWRESFHYYDLANYPTHTNEVGEDCTKNAVIQAPELFSTIKAIFVGLYEHLDSYDSKAKAFDAKFLQLAQTMISTLSEGTLVMILSLEGALAELKRRWNDEIAVQENSQVQENDLSAGYIRELETQVSVLQQTLTYQQQILPPVDTSEVSLQDDVIENLKSELKSCRGEIESLKAGQSNIVISQSDPITAEIGDLRLKLHDANRTIQDLKQSKQSLSEDKEALTGKMADYQSKFTRLQEECHNLVTQHEELYATLTDYERQYEMVYTLAKKGDFALGAEDMAMRTRDQKHPLAFTAYYNHLIALYDASRHNLSHQQQRWTDVSQKNEELKALTNGQQESLDSLARALEVSRVQAAERETEAEHLKASLTETDQKVRTLEGEKQLLERKLQRILVGYSTLMGQ